ncbi:DUF397 domain-containing protein [Micromonospora schwarzwaldensis]|uniref:DUF397 domain-containing protein n=1 Tax=Micromonospora sp. DSM 45708 TaxID=3111767 RepID=UPI0031E02A00
MTTPTHTWRKSSRSDDGNCVEVAIADAVLVRDSKDPQGPILRFDARAWHTFVSTPPIGGLGQPATR